ncbi:MAG TPA: hypothetical protein VKB95_05895 [Chitinophagaceae bacterium]|nr:hypothetical protein [Chitinophagaceae bacterium]
MNESKKKFWKFFLLIALYMFAATLAVGCVWNLIAKDPVSTLFTSSALLHRAFDAIIAGFLISFLLVLIKKKNPD